MAGYGISAADIAGVLDMDAEVLKSTFAAELVGNTIKPNTRVAEAHNRNATGDGRDAVTAANRGADSLDRKAARQRSNRSVPYWRPFLNAGKCAASPQRRTDSRH